MILVSYGRSNKDIVKSAKTVNARHLSRQSINNILETLGAIKTVGKFFINCENRTSDNKHDVIQNSSLGEYAFVKNNSRRFKQYISSNCLFATLNELLWTFIIFYYSVKIIVSKVVCTNILFSLQRWL